jgi:hypothetical protein
MQAFIFALYGPAKITGIGAIDFDKSLSVSSSARPMPAWKRIRTEVGGFPPYVGIALKSRQYRRMAGGWSGDCEFRDLQNKAKGKMRKSAAKSEITSP